MLGTLQFTLGAIAAPAAEPLAHPALAPVLILVLCVVAGVGTVLMLPSRVEASIRTIGAVVTMAAGLILLATLVRYAADYGGGMGFYFWFFAAVAILAAVRVITHTRPVYSALYFVLTVLASAGLFILLWAEFMAAALVLIYAGAILVTYVFVIMLAAQAAPTVGGEHGATATSEESPPAEYDAVSREPLAACAIGFALMGVLLFVIFDRAPGQLASRGPINPPGTPLMTRAANENTQALGDYLFKNQLINLELAGVLLTVAMVGAIIIARRRVQVGGQIVETAGDVVIGPATPIDDNPHSIPVYGTDNPRQKQYPEA